MIYLHTKFLIPSFSCALVTVVKVEAKENVCTVRTTPI